MQKTLEEGGRAAFDEGGSFAVAVEFEELREEREDEGEGDLYFGRESATRYCKE